MTTNNFQPPPEEFEDGDVYGHLAQPPTTGPLDEDDVEAHSTPTAQHDLPPRDTDIER